MKKTVCSAYMNNEVFELQIKPEHCNFQIPIQTGIPLPISIYFNGIKFEGPSSLRFTSKGNMYYWITSENKTKSLLDKFLLEHGVKRYNPKLSKSEKETRISRLLVNLSDDYKECYLQEISYNEYRNFINALEVESQLNKHDKVQTKVLKNYREIIKENDLYFAICTNGEHQGIQIGQRSYSGYWYLDGSRIFNKVLVFLKQKQFNEIYTGCYEGKEAEGDKWVIYFSDTKFEGITYETWTSFTGGKYPGYSRIFLTANDQEINETDEQKVIQHLGSQGYQIDSKEKDLIEQYSMEKAIEYYESQGYTVTDMHVGRPFDLLCIKDNHEILVEVKGSKNCNIQKVHLSYGEVLKNMGGALMELLVVDGIILKKENDNLTPSGGAIKVYKDWVVKNEDIKPITYEYTIKDKPDYQELL